MTRHLRTTAIWATLLVLFGSAALGQDTPRNINGRNPDQFASGDPESFVYQIPDSDSLESGVRRLPPTRNTETPINLATMDVGRPYGSSETSSPIGEICDVCSEYECQCGPRWVISADALWMSRSRANSQSMIFSLVTVGELFNASELTFEARSGFRMSWGYDLPNGRAVELAAMNVYDQPASARVSGTDLYYLIHNISPFTTTDAYTINYMSNLHSGELNWWLHEIWGIRPMLGVRWIRVREEFAILDTLNTSSDIASQIKNDLVGAQIGFKTRLWNGGNWFRVEAALKGGVYQNTIRYRATEYDNVGPTLRIERFPSSTSLAGELTISAIVQWCPNLAVRFGYHGLWMSEMGLAPNQANQSDFLTGNGSDDFEPLSFNGGFVGLEANW